MKPSLGRIVITKVDPADNNGADVCPAVITRVWGERPDGAWTVNVRTLHDGAAVGWKTSIALYDSEDLLPDNNTHVAYWPPRV